MNKLWCWLLLMAAGAIGCGDDDIGPDMRREAAEWRALHITDYAFVWKQYCFCSPVDPGGTRVEVREGQAISAIGVTFGVPLRNHLLTIDGIFDLVKNNEARELVEHEISFDQTHHFITQYSSDQDKNTIDDEFGLRVLCFSRDIDNGCPIKTLTMDECLDRAGVPTPIETRCPAWPGPIGRIAGTEQVCCLACEDGEPCDRN